MLQMETRASQRHPVERLSRPSPRRGSLSLLPTGERGGLTIIDRAGNEARAMLILARLPHHGDLINRHIAHALILILQLQHAAFDPDHLSAQARRAPAKDVYLATD